MITTLVQWPRRSSLSRKGMPTWGPVLGPKRIAEAVAYVLSHHHEGEPIIDAATVAGVK